MIKETNKTDTPHNDVLAIVFPLSLSLSLILIANSHACGIPIKKAFTHSDEPQEKTKKQNAHMRIDDLIDMETCTS